jgi:hypothetical protein
MTILLKIDALFYEDTHPDFLPQLRTFPGAPEFKARPRPTLLERIRL